MSGKFGPRRRLRSEMLSMAVAAAVPVLLALSFPLDALRPLPPAPESAREPSCAFVTLTPVEERGVLASARAAWQLNRRAELGMSIDLFAAPLPPMKPRAVLGLSAMPRTDRSTPAPYAPDPLPPTLAAPPPQQIAPQPDADAPTFSREELLKLN